MAPFVKKLHEARIAVLGDVMLDRFIWGRVSRISPEAPVPVVDVDRARVADGHRLGGAANVAHNISRLGGRVSLHGVVGNDEAATVLTRLLAEKGIDGRGLRAAPGRVTTLKTRIVAQGQQVVRFDVEDRTTLEPDLAIDLYQGVLDVADNCDAVIISDYAKGVVDTSRLPELIDTLRKRGKVVAIDPKVSHLEGYRGATLVTPNKLEACSATGTDPETPDAPGRAGKLLLERLETEAVLVTLGDEGMLLLRPGLPELSVPARAVEVFDVTGAGDTVIAALTMALAVGAPWEEAVHLANAAAGIVVGKVGTSVVSPEELERELARWQ